MAMFENIRKIRETRTMGESYERDIEFAFYAPLAKNVCLADKFNERDTSSLPMKKGKDGIWRITLKLSPGQHEYKYFSDDDWAQEIPCSDKIPNPFGTYNCVTGVQ